MNATKAREYFLIKRVKERPGINAADLTRDYNAGSNRLTFPETSSDYLAALLWFTEKPLPAEEKDCMRQPITSL